MPVSACYGAVVLVAAMASAVSAAGGGVVAEGLVVNYDFTAGSLPDEEGLVKDLSGSGIHATIRPTTVEPGAPFKSDLPRTGWLDHRIRQGDGKGGWITRPAKIQALKQPGADHTMPFGLVKMDNGEIAVICSWERTGQPTRPIIAFSKDGGDTWTDFQVVPGAGGRPMNLTYHGGGTLSFVTGRRYYSHDYGRTWPENVEHPRTQTGMTFHLEGNAWVDRDEDGEAKAILELGWHYEPGKSHPTGDATVVFRRSLDGGRTWGDEVAPPQWKFEMTHKGKTWLRGVSEGAVVRATNGDLVAALRTDIPPHFFDGPHNDNLEGTSISISEDDGKTWSEMNFLFYAGRHHANLQRLPSGDLVCTMIVRDDVREGKLASHRRGCDAVISHDHGRTWDLGRRYELDRFDHYRPGNWLDGQCGHIGAVALDDGHVISAYGHYAKGAAVLVKWKPDAEPALPLSEGNDAESEAVSGSIYEQVAAKDVHYRVVAGDRPGLVLGGAAWIDIPFDDRLLAVSGDATIEIILKPDTQGGMPSLLRCASIAKDRPGLAFQISYDQRHLDHSKQVLYSDERIDAEKAEYTIQVDLASKPKPFEPVMHQIAYVVRDGSGRFYRDGSPFSRQTESGSAVGKAGELLFSYCTRHGVAREDVRLAIGAAPYHDRIAAGLRATVAAFRVYSRALTPRELRRNRAATLGVPPRRRDRTE